MANNALVTTGLTPLTIGSTETFEARDTLDGLPWDLTGGSAKLLMTDPSGLSYTYTATITAGVPYVNWTVLAPAGTWLRAWRLQDSVGVIQFSRPIVFQVINSPS